MALLENFTFGGGFARIDKSVIAGYLGRNQEVRDRLQTLNLLLRPYDLHFGYRVQDEIISFLVAAEHNGTYEELSGHDTAFDAAVLMKILPKFHGSRGKLEEPLKNVLAWCIDPDSPNMDVIEQKIIEANDSGSVVQILSQVDYRYPKTADRIHRMLWSLYTTGFASFG
jgi:5-methylcytosine-specific restriction protein B